jgi:hypothetical protein
MRVSLHGLAISGALAVAAALSPAMAQTESTMQDARVVQVANAARLADTRGESRVQGADPAQAASPAQGSDPVQAASPAQGTDPAQAASPTQPASPAQPASLALAADATTVVSIPADDLKKAGSEIRASWHDYDKCTRSKVCSSYFESFGVGLTFGDGEIVPFAHVQRLTASRHDCIVNARDALDHGNRGMAVQWVMASRMLEPLDRNWLGDHPDAVLAALREILF